VVNAVSTYVGSAYAIGLRAVVEVCTGGVDDEVRSRWGIDTGGLLRVISWVKHRLGVSANLRVFTHGDLPPVGGLKSSSAVVNSTIAALSSLVGVRLSPMELLRLNAESSMEAGLSITGALDDAAASLLGGLVVTDNRGMRIIRWMSVPRMGVLVYVPSGAGRRRGAEWIGRTRSLGDEANEAIRLILGGDFLGAVRIGGVVNLVALGMDEVPVLIARRLGALGSVSGTGPAYVFLGDSLGALEEELRGLGGECILTSTVNEVSRALGVLLGD
jgi:shikimate kinase